LKECEAKYNILTVVNDFNSKKQKEVYQFFKDIEAVF
jgi:sulfatase maturation enzyme AslB (radical SAM superfamily)